MIILIISNLIYVEITYGLTKMVKITPKPIPKEAIQWTGKNIKDIQDFVLSTDFDIQDDYIYLETLEGPMEVSPGSWVVRGVNGEYYSIKDDILRKSYDIESFNNMNEHIKTFELRPTDSLRAWRHISVCYKGKPIGPVIDLKFSLMAVQLDMSTEDFMRDYYNETIDRI